MSDHEIVEMLMLLGKIVWSVAGIAAGAFSIFANGVVIWRIMTGKRLWT
jgi:hypothetical protein